MRMLLRKKRLAKGFTQAKIGEIVGIKRNSYTQIETGDRNPSFELSKKIKISLDYYEDDLFENTD